MESFFPHTKVRALPKHNNKYYKICKFSIRTLFRSVVSRGFRALLYNSQLLQFSISVSSYSSCLYSCLLFLSFHSLSEKEKNTHTHTHTSNPFFLIPWTIFLLFIFFNFNWYLIYALTWLIHYNLDEKMSNQLEMLLYTKHNFSGCLCPVKYLSCSQHNNSVEIIIEQSNMNRTL